MLSESTHAAMHTSSIVSKHSYIIIVVYRKLSSFSILASCAVGAECTTSVVSKNELSSHQKFITNSPYMVCWDFDLIGQSSLVNCVFSTYSGQTERG